MLERLPAVKAMEKTHEWRLQQAVNGKARSFELREIGGFKPILSVRTKQPMTINEMQRLMSLAK